MTDIFIHKKTTGAHPVDIVSLPIGGRYINNMFEDLLSTSMEFEGSKFIKKCQEKYLVAWLDLVLKFEAAKKAVCYSEESNVYIDMFYGFSEAFTKITRRDLVEVMTGRENKGVKQITLSNTGKLFLSGKILMLMWGNGMQVIWEALDKMMKNNKFKYRGILLAGGFAESTFFYEYLCSKQETKEMMPVWLFRPENSTSLLTIGAIASAKQNH